MKKRLSLRGVARRSNLKVFWDEILLQFAALLNIMRLPRPLRELAMT